MWGHFAVLLAVAAADSSVDVCVSGTCADTNPFKSSMLLQSKSSTAVGSSVHEDPPDPVVPPEVVRQIVERRQRQPKEALTDQAEEAWIDLSPFDSSESASPSTRRKMHDGIRDTHGGAIEFHLDMGEVYQISKTRADFRACQCNAEGSVLFAVSMDKKNWYTYLSPTVFAWGEHRELTFHHHSLRARYVKVWVTSLASIHWLGLWELQLFGKKAPDSHPNVYGWWHSYRAGRDGLSGTEIVQLHAYKGKLFGGTGYWMNSNTWRAAEVVRLDCPYCDWVIENIVFPYAGRTEILKSIEWTTNKDGNKLAAPVPKLLSGFYVNYNGEGRCYTSVRDDDSLNWHLEVYWAKSPFQSNYFSARALQLYQDTVTGVDMLFFNTGMDGIVAGTYEPNKNTKVSFRGATESGSRSACRPLALAIMDNRLFFSASSQIKRRVNGNNPSWELVWDQLDVDDAGTVDEAVGGIRGLVGITSDLSPSGESLLFNWAPNGRAEGCTIRLDPKADGSGFQHTQEKCVKEMAGLYLGNNVDGLTPKVTYSLADYNYALELPDLDGKKVNLIGYQILLFAFSCNDFPTDPTQTRTTSSGKPIGYYAGAGYLIRRSADDYEAREPGGKRYDPLAIFPKLVAVRALVQSPWPNDLAVYMGGYDANFFNTADSAWIMSASFDAVFQAPVPCQKELGCGHTPGEDFQVFGCDWCKFREFDGSKLVSFQNGGAVTCQDNMDFLNSDAGAQYCDVAPLWPSEPICCLGERCDVCLGSGKTFQATATAGQTSAGVPYNCKTALDYIDAGSTTCSQGRAWWSPPCCA